MSVKLQLKIASDGQLAYDRFPLGNLPNTAREHAEALVTKVEFVVVHQKVRWVKFYCSLVWYFLIFALITYTAVVYLKDSPGIAKRIESSIETGLGQLTGEDYLDINSWASENSGWLESFFETQQNVTTLESEDTDSQSSENTGSTSDAVPAQQVTKNYISFRCQNSTNSTQVSEGCLKLEQALEEAGVVASGNFSQQKHSTNQTVQLVSSVMSQTERARQFRLVFWYASIFLLARLYAWYFADAVFHWNNQRVLKGILYRENSDIFWQSGYYWFIDAKNMDLMAVRFAPRLQRKTNKIRNHPKKSSRYRWPVLPAFSLEEVSEIGQEDSLFLAAPSPINSDRLNTSLKKPKSRASSHKSGAKKVVFSEPEITEPEGLQETKPKEEVTKDGGTTITQEQQPPVEQQASQEAAAANNMMWQQQMYQQWMMHQQYMFFQMMRQHEQAGHAGNINMPPPNPNMPPFGAAYYGPVNNYYNHMAPMYAAQFGGDPMAAQWMAGNMQNHPQMGFTVDPDQTEEFSVSAVEETEEASQVENTFSKHRSLGKDGPRVSLAATTRKHPRSSKSNKKN